MPEELPETVPVVEEYKDYSPPYPLAHHISHALLAVPPRFLKGLDSVVLTEFPRLSRKERRAKGDKRLDGAHGRYFLQNQGTRPYIEIYVDKVLSPQILSKNEPVELQITRLATVLFHEVGHHIHLFHTPKHRNDEREADRYKSQLLWAYFHHNPEIKKVLKRYYTEHPEA